MSDISYWMLFFTSALLLNISPGPDMIYILSRTLAHGSKIGTATVLGVCSGAFVHILGAALGLAALLATSESAFTFIKVLGALYLAYLGITTLIQTESKLKLAQSSESLSFKRAYIQGVFIDILNPKVALFFLAFLPQFVRAEMGSESLQIIGLGGLVILVALLVELGFVFFASKARDFFVNRTNTSTIFNKILGLVFLGLATRLLFIA